MPIQYSPDVDSTGVGSTSSIDIGSAWGAELQSIAIGTYSVISTGFLDRPEHPVSTNTHTLMNKPRLSVE